MTTDIMHRSDGRGKAPDLIAAATARHKPEATTAATAASPAVDERAVRPPGPAAWASAAIVVVRDLNKSLGKRFEIDDDGAVKKSSQATVSKASAVVRPVPDAEAFANVLREVTEDPHAALILGVPIGIKPGEPFAILSAKALARLLGCDEHDRDVLAGVHEVEIDGTKTKAIARLKVNFKPSSWALLDRDVDEHTPARFRGDYDAWLRDVERLIPGVGAAERVWVPSSSARVLRDGSPPVGVGNGHTFIMLANADDAERLRRVLHLRAVLLGMSWKKPRKSKDTGEVVSHGDATVIDWSVFSPERLVFDGKPIAGSGLTVVPAEIVVTPGQPTVDTSSIVLPDDVCEQLALMGSDLKVSRDGGTITIADDTLRLDTLLEVENGTSITVRDAMETPRKLRVQAPFRASESVAAFLGYEHDGRPFVHDSGTGTNHRLNGPEWTPIWHARLLDGFKDGAAAARARLAAFIDTVPMVGEPRSLAQFDELVGDDVRMVCDDYGAAQVKELLERLRHATGHDPERLLRQSDRSDRIADALVALSKFIVTERQVKAMKETRLIWRDLIAQAHVAVWAAPGNGGKTTLARHAAADLVAAGFQVFFLQEDAGAGDLPRLHAHAKASGYELLNSALAGEAPERILAVLHELVQGEADLSTTVLFFDTIKKFCDLMSKGGSREFFRLARALTLRGATVVLLGHTNKHRGADGKLVFEGVGDVRNDVDEMLYIEAGEKDADGVVTLTVKPDKVRCHIKEASFRLDTKSMTVEPLAEVVNVAVARRRADQRKKDADIIDCVRQALQAGPLPKTALVKRAMEASGFGEPRVRAVIGCYCNAAPDGFWSESPVPGSNTVLVKLHPVVEFDPVESADAPAF